MKKKSDIILNFDFDYIQLLFDGDNIFCTYENLMSLKFKTTKFNKLPTLSRIVKAYKKGFSFYDKSDFINIDTINSNSFSIIKKIINIIILMIICLMIEKFILFN